VSFCEGVREYKKKELVRTAISHYIRWRDDLGDSSLIISLGIELLLEMGEGKAQGLSV